MRCLICQKLSFVFICKSCQKDKLTPHLKHRILPNGLKVFYFYKYKDIEPILQSKYYFIGYFIYKILAKKTFKKFAQEFSYANTLYALACDSHVRNGYSNTDILLHALKSKSKSKNITPLHNKLTTKTNINYAGKDLNYRLKHPKKFIYHGAKNIDTILVDDIVVSGTTLSLAYKELIKNDVNVLFALTLADAKE